MFGEFTVTALFVGPNGMRDKVPVFPCSRLGEKSNLDTIEFAYVRF
jgi:hypothetical protein